MNTAAVRVPFDVDLAVDRLTGVVARLAADEFTGRRVGTAGGRAVEAWLADYLVELGADVATQDFPVAEVREHCSVFSEFIARCTVAGC